jgi:putative addiction module component (TIGR02574 family)
MTMPGKSISLEGMSVAERILLVEQIWDGIAAEPEAIEVTQAQRDELDRRLAADDADPSAGASWDEVKKRIQRKA